MKITTFFSSPERPNAKTYIFGGMSPLSLLPTQLSALSLANALDAFYLITHSEGVCPKDIATILDIPELRASVVGRHLIKAGLVRPRKIKRHGGYLMVLQPDPKTGIPFASLLAAYAQSPEAQRIVKKYAAQHKAGRLMMQTWGKG